MTKFLCIVVIYNVVIVLLNDVIWHVQIEMCADELDAARWFSREDVALAYENTIRDPQLIFASRSDEVQQELKYIPPQGAIAHRIIKHWLDEKSSWSLWIDRHVDDYIALCSDLSTDKNEGTEALTCAS